MSTDAGTGDSLPSPQPDHIIGNSSQSTNNKDSITSSKSDDISIASETAIEFNAKPIKQKLRILFSNHHYKRVLPFIIVWVIAGYMPAVFFAPWGAEQFSDCVAHTADEEAENECSINYTEYNRMASLFSSLGGLMTLIFGGLIGRISDSFGRKPIFYLNTILSAALYSPLVIFPNVWLNFVMRIPAGLNSSDNSFTPMMVAYMSDIMPEYQRTMGYATAYAFSAIGLFVGVGLAITLGISAYNFTSVFFFFCFFCFYCWHTHSITFLHIQKVFSMAMNPIS